MFGTSIQILFQIPSKPTSEICGEKSRCAAFQNSFTPYEATVINSIKPSNPHRIPFSLSLFQVATVILIIPFRGNKGRGESINTCTPGSFSTNTQTSYAPCEPNKLEVWTLFSNIKVLLRYLYFLKARVFISFCTPTFNAQIYCFSNTDEFR